MDIIDIRRCVLGVRSDEFIGQILAERSQDVLIATKVYHKAGKGPYERSASRQHIIDGVESILRLLVEY